jgi:hypothetical protein
MANQRRDVCAFPVRLKIVFDATHICYSTALELNSQKAVVACVVPDNRWEGERVRYDVDHSVGAEAAAAIANGGPQPQMHCVRWRQRACPLHDEHQKFYHAPILQSVRLDLVCPLASPLCAACIACFTSPLVFHLKLLLCVRWGCCTSVIVIGFFGV